MSALSMIMHKRSNLLVYILALAIPAVCVVLLLTMTAFAKNTYLINDGGRLLIHTTYASDPAEILNEAGLELDSGDTFTTQPGSGMQEITIQRRQTILISYQGENLEFHSYGETLGALLQRMELRLASEDILSLPLDTQTYNGMTVIISRANRVVESNTTVIPYNTVYCQDPNLPEGEQKVLVPGKEGSLASIEEVYYLNGEEISRVTLSQSVVAQSVDALVAVGTGVKQPTQSGTVTTASGQTLTYVKKMTMKATAYSRFDEGCNDYTATGALARYGVVAVDPKVIPLGSTLYIVSNDGVYIYGVASAQDTGGAIKGNRIDLCFDTVEECFQFGRRECTVYVIAD